MSRPLIGVFALQGNVREHVAMLRQVGADAIPVRRPAELATVDGLVLPGGESTTMEKLARAFDLFEPLRKAIADGLPVFGTCAGMILLADEITGGTSDQQTLGGLDMTVRRNAFGRQVDSFEADLSFAAFETPYHAVFIRAPWVERVGRDVEVLATIETEGTQHPVAVRRDTLLATSFHPELTGDPRLHGLFTTLVASS